MKCEVCEVVLLAVIKGVRVGGDECFLIPWNKVQCLLFYWARVICSLPLILTLEEERVQLIRLSICIFKSWLVVFQ